MPVQHKSRVGQVAMRKPKVWCAGAAALSLLVIGPALGQVKAGVDAWARGDYATAVQQWQGPSAAGDADAQFNLAQAYKLGRGVKQDFTRAEALYGKAAAQGHIQAADNYGLLLFQRGAQKQALPYITASADRGDPRAQYLLGIARFNGDLVAKDWVRAYALVSLAQQAGLAQAKSALAQMDQYIPLDQRQRATVMSADMSEAAEANRARQFAAVDLGTTGAPALDAVIAPLPAGSPPAIVAARDAVATARRVAGADSPRAAGAHYARPARVAVAPPPPGPVAPVKLAAIKPPVVKAAPALVPIPLKPVIVHSAVVTASGPWRVQLGAFGVASNAEALWNRVKSHPELAGHPKLLVPAGRVMKLQASGFATSAAAQAACERIASGGVNCIAVQK